MQERLSYCVPLGIPYTTFISWPEDDQAYALAWRRRENRKCNSCGTFPEDWLDEGGGYLDDPPFEVSAVRCYGCEMLAEEQDLANEDGKSRRRYIFGFRRRTKRERNS